MGLLEQQGKAFGKWFGYSGREPIPAKRKNEVKDRVKRKFGRIVCEQCGKKPYRVTLEYHHKNKKNSDNRLKNLVLLCPTHHRQKHPKKIKSKKSKSRTRSEYWVTLPKSTIKLR